MAFSTANVSDCENISQIEFDFDSSPQSLSPAPKKRKSTSGIPIRGELKKRKQRKFVKRIADIEENLECSPKSQTLARRPVKMPVKRAVARPDSYPVSRQPELPVLNKSRKKIGKSLGFENISQFDTIESECENISKIDLNLDSSPQSLPLAGRPVARRPDSFPVLRQPELPVLNKSKKTNKKKLPELSGLSEIDKFLGSHPTRASVLSRYDAECLECNTGLRDLPEFQQVEYETIPETHLKLLDEKRPRYPPFECRLADPDVIQRTFAECYESDMIKSKAEQYTHNLNEFDKFPRRCVKPKEKKSNRNSLQCNNISIEQQPGKRSFPEEMNQICANYAKIRQNRARKNTERILSDFESLPQFVDPQFESSCQEISAESNGEISSLYVSVDDRLNGKIQCDGTPEDDIIAQSGSRNIDEVPCNEVTTMRHSVADIPSLDLSVNDRLNDNIQFEGDNYGSTDEKNEQSGSKNIAVDEVASKGRIKPKCNRGLNVYAPKQICPRDGTTFTPGRPHYLCNISKTGYCDLDTSRCRPHSNSAFVESEAGGHRTLPTTGSAISQVGQHARRSLRHGRLHGRKDEECVQNKSQHSINERRCIPELNVIPPPGPSGQMANQSCAGSAIQPVGQHCRRSLGLPDQRPRCQPDENILDPNAWRVPVTSCRTPRSGSPHDRSSALRNQPVEPNQGHRNASLENQPQVLTSRRRSFQLPRVNVVDLYKTVRQVVSGLSSRQPNAEKTRKVISPHVNQSNIPCSGSPPNARCPAKRRRSDIPHGNRLPNDPPSAAGSCCRLSAHRRRHTKAARPKPKLSPRPWLPTDKPNKKKEFTLTVEQKALVLDNYYPGLIHDAVNQQADFNEIAKKFVTPESAVDGNKAEKGMSLIEAFDTRVKFEQINLAKLLKAGGAADKSKQAQMDTGKPSYQPVYGPIAHPVISDTVLEENVRASAIPVDLQQYVRTTPENDPVRAIACLTRAQRLNDYYKEYKAAQTAAHLAPPDKIEEAALYGAKSFKIESLSAESKTIENPGCYKSMELVSYVGVTKPD